MAELLGEKRHKAVVVMDNLLHSLACISQLLHLCMGTIFTHLQPMKTSYLGSMEPEGAHNLENARNMYIVYSALPSCIVDIASYPSCREEPG